MVAVFRVAHGSAAGGSLGQRGFNLEHCIGFLCGLLGRVAGESEHFDHVFAILLADGLEALAIGDVVVAVRQRQSGLAYAGNLF